MIHDDESTSGTYIKGASVDGGSADAPRFRWWNGGGSTLNYDVDWRYVAA
jgi:hypothetical protein